MTMLIDIPFWMYAIGWFTSQLVKLNVSFLLLILCLNKIDQWVARRGKNETINNTQGSDRSGKDQS